MTIANTPSLKASNLPLLIPQALQPQPIFNDSELRVGHEVGRAVPARRPFSNEIEAHRPCGDALKIGKRPFGWFGDYETLLHMQQSFVIMSAPVAITSASTKSTMDDAPEAAAAGVLRGVKRNRAIIVEPWHGRLLWRCLSLVAMAAEAAAPQNGSRLQEFAEFSIR